MGNEPQGEITTGGAVPAAPERQGSLRRADEQRTILRRDRSAARGRRQLDSAAGAAAICRCLVQTHPSVNAAGLGWQRILEQVLGMNANAPGMLKIATEQRFALHDA